PYYLYRQKYMSGGFENIGWQRGQSENIYNICIMEELCSIISMGGGASTKLCSVGGRLEHLYNPKYPHEYIADIDKIISEKQKIKEILKWHTI
ncbi:MAG: coproporphyrinogen dehydrogenase HemZ, partial [Oscillospiraceae bacterium]